MGFIRMAVHATSIQDGRHARRNRYLALHGMGRDDGGICLDRPQPLDGDKDDGQTGQQKSPSFCHLNFLHTRLNINESFEKLNGRLRARGGCIRFSKLRDVFSGYSFHGRFFDWESARNAGSDFNSHSSPSIPLHELGGDPHLTLTLSPPIGWERRGTSKRMPTVAWKSSHWRRVQGFNARIFSGKSLIVEGRGRPQSFGGEAEKETAGHGDGKAAEDCRTPRRWRVGGIGRRL